MKLSNEEKYAYSFAVLGILLLGTYFYLGELNMKSYQTKSFDCDNWGVIYLKPSEVGLASGIADRGNVAVVVSDNPNETNGIIASTGITSCANFHYADYLNTFGNE